MGSKAKILIVDDEVNIRLTLTKILALKGYVVATAENGLRAVETLKKERFDVILMDVKMPVMDGLEALRHIKQTRPSATIIFMSAFSVEDMIKDVIKGGAYAMLKKPLDIDTVIKTIEDSRKGLLLAVVDDDPELGKVMKAILEKNGYNVSICLTGEEAIDMARKKPHDIFFIDINLPFLNGFEVFLRIKEIVPDAIVLMMTAYRQEMDEIVNRSIKKGAYTCLYKPLNMDEVLELIEELSKEIKNESANN